VFSDFFDDALGGFSIEVMGVEDDGGDKWNLEWLFNESKPIKLV
jgi:hypothetical protein